MLRLIRTFWHTAGMAATSAAADGGAFLLLDYVLRLLRVALLLSVWRMILAGQTTPAGGDVGAATGLALDTILTYTLVAAVFADPLAARTRLEEALWNGSIATRFLQPVSIAGHFAAEMVGGWLPGFVFFSAPLFLAAPLLGVSPLPAGPLAGLLFPLSLVLGVAVGMAVDFLLCALMVTFGWSVWEVERWRSALATVLSGALIPLSVLPWNLGQVLSWLPFAAMAWAPLSVYTGSPDTPRLLAMQAFWAAALWLVGQRLWQANRQKVVIYGG